MSVLKRTRSLCPECLKVVDAEAREEHGEVWLYKACEAHGESKGLVERDVDFYKKAMNPSRVTYEGPLRVMVPITHRCNLDCAFCYVPNRERPDLTISDLEQRVAGLPPFLLCLTGGEPTLHENLLQMIRHMHRHRNVISIGLVTNGLKLADPDFVQSLERAGLNWMLFSFNGFNDEMYMDTNKKPLLEIKLKALENLKRSRMEVALSPTIVRGLNEDELERMIDFIMDNDQAFFQLRVRSAAQVGTYTATDSLCTSELIELFGRVFGLGKDHFIDDFDPNSCYHSPYQFNIAADIRRDNGRKRLNAWGHGLFSRPGARRRLPMDARPLFVNLWGWPDKHSIDIDDIQSSGVMHMTHDGKILNFSEAIVRYEEL